MLQNLAIVGATKVGRDLALTAIKAGLRVTIVDKSSESVEESIRTELGKDLRHQFLFVDDLRNEIDCVNMQMSLMRTCTSLNETGSADFIIETMPDDLERKRALVTKLDRICPPYAVIASHTECLDLSSLAANVTNKQRMIGINFSQPIMKTGLMEYVLPSYADTWVKDTVIQLAERLKKKTLQCEKSGFAVNRVLVKLAEEVEGMSKSMNINKKDLENAIKCGTGLQHFGSEAFIGDHSSS